MLEHGGLWMAGARGSSWVPLPKGIGPGLILCSRRVLVSKHLGQRNGRPPPRWSFHAWQKVSKVMLLLLSSESMPPCILGPTCSGWASPRSSQDLSACLRSHFFGIFSPPPQWVSYSQTLHLFYQTSRTGSLISFKKRYSSLINWRVIAWNSSLQ